MNITAVISWSTVWSVLPDMVCENAGLTRAATPWSGHYFVDSALWASAHITQFAQPGWHFLSVPGGGSGVLGGGGHYVTLVDDASAPTRFVTVIETLDAPGGRCIVTPSAQGPQTAILSLAKGMPRPQAGVGASLWKTNETHQFVLVAEGLTATEQPDGSAILALPEPVQNDAMYTLTSHPGAQSHGVPSAPVPEPASFPAPFHDDFETAGATGTGNTLMPRYWSDQYGLFERKQTGGARGFVLEQKLYNQPGSNSWGASEPPLTVVGDFNWTDYTVSADVQLAEQPLRGSTEEVGLLPCADASSSAAAFQVFANSTIAPNYLRNKGLHLCLNTDGCGAAGTGVILYQCIVGQNTCDSPPAPGQKYNTLNLQWSLTPEGQLRSLLHGLCVQPAPPSAGMQAGGAIVEMPGAGRDFFTAGAAPAASPRADRGPVPAPLVIEPCASPQQPGQTWSALPSGQLRHEATGQCLSAPEPAVFVSICGRMSKLNGFQGTIAQVCLVANRTAWSIVEDSGHDAPVLSDGPMPAGAWSPDGWASLSLSLVGETATATVGGVRVGGATLSGPSLGMVSLSSGFHQAAWDNVAVVTAA